MEDWEGLMKKIDDYFDNVSDEKLEIDLVKAGFRITCNEHPEFIPLHHTETTCERCNHLAQLYKEHWNQGRHWNWDDPEED